MYLNKIHIQNIRSIVDFVMDFQNPAGWHVIIGDNGAGKSSVIRSVSATLIGPEEINTVVPVWSEWLSYDQQNGSIELDIAPDWVFDTIGRGQPSKNTIKNRFELRRKHGIVKLESNINANKLPPKNYNWGKNKGWFSAAYGPFRRFSGGDERKSKNFYAYPKVGAHLSALGEDIALSESLDWLKELDRRRLKELENKNDAENSASSIFELIKAFINTSQLLPHSAKFDQVDFDGNIVFRDGNNSIIKVLELSDGYRSVLSLIFELLRQLINCYDINILFKLIRNDEGEIIEMIVDVPGVVLIDEIDAHLHPTWQTKIGDWFTKIFPKIQFIVTTHSPLICRASEKGTIWRLRAPGSAIPSGEIIGSEKEKLIFGSVLDAYGTELFGRKVTRSDHATQRLNKLSELNVKSTFGKLEKSEQLEQEQLRKIFASDDTSEF